MKCECCGADLNTSDHNLVFRNGDVGIVCKNCKAFTLLFYMSNLNNAIDHSTPVINNVYSCSSF